MVFDEVDKRHDEYGLQCVSVLTYKIGNIYQMGTSPLPKLGTPSSFVALMILRGW